MGIVCPGGPEVWGSYGFRAKCVAARIKFVFYCLRSFKKEIIEVLQLNKGLLLGSYFSKICSYNFYLN